MIAIVGSVLFLLGLVAGGVLVAAPFGLLAGAASAYAAVSLWLLFPLFCALGYALVVIGTSSRTALRATSLSAWLLMLLALSAAIALFGAATGWTPGANTLSLWYVMVLAGVFGGVGTAAAGGARVVDRSHRVAA